MEAENNYTANADMGQMLFKGQLAEADGLLRQIEAVGPRHGSVVSLLRETEDILSRARHIAECLQDNSENGTERTDQCDNAGMPQDRISPEDNDNDMEHSCCCGGCCDCRRDVDAETSGKAQRQRKHRLLRRPRHIRKNGEHATQDVAARLWFEVRRKYLVSALAIQHVLNSCQYPSMAMQSLTVTSFVVTAKAMKGLKKATSGRKRY